MSGTAQISRHRVLVDGDLNRLGAVLCADAGGDAEFRCGIDADGKRGALLFRVLFSLLRQAELVGALAGERETDPSARLTDHEVDHLRRDELRGADEIALVLAILVVGDDDKLAGLDVGNCLLDRSKTHMSQ